MENLTGGVLPQNMSREELAKLAKALESRGFQIKGPKARKSGVEVSTYGHITFHNGDVRKPGISLYVDEWIALINNIKQVQDFIQANANNTALVTLPQSREKKAQQRAQEA